MLAFHKIFTFLFKSFRIDGEIQLLQKVYSEGITEAMIIKRSWVFVLLILWMPILLVLFLGLEVYLTLNGLIVSWTSYLTIGLLIVVLISFLITQLYYISYFRKLHKNIEITLDIPLLITQIKKSDSFFIRFFNWSFFVQILLLGIFIEVLFLLFFSTSVLSIFYLLGELVCSLVSFFILSGYRKKIMDLEMDYNIVVDGKIYFINQSGFLSQMQTIESSKIKSIQAVYPNKVAALFDFGTIHVLTEGDDTESMGTMSMYYVTSPEKTVDIIQKILSKK